jgi:hypothetical protein
MISLLLSLAVTGVVLPVGEAPDALVAPHFPDQFHAVVWRNWQVAPAERIAQAVGTTPENVVDAGRAMGLAGPPEITNDQWRRSYITVIRRNWHLLPYDQLLVLLGWTPEELDFALREDDFLFHKLGRLKPKCAPVTYAPPTAEVIAQRETIARVVRETFPQGAGRLEEPLFYFVDELSTAPVRPAVPELDSAAVRPEQPSFCYSYFALYGDPLLDESIDPYPDAYLARLRAAGVNGIWLQGVLFKLVEFPWDKSLSEGYETRLKNLRTLAQRARRHGMGVYLYLNEPRSMPLAFFNDRPDIKGVAEGDYAALCTSSPEVQRYLRDGMAAVSRAVPELAGVFTITASENLTNCWSHYQGHACPRCSVRAAPAVVAEVNSLLAEGLRDAGHGARLIAWDWGWQDAWSAEAIQALPTDAALMCTSEWGLPIVRGGVASTVGEYSISAIGPGERAKRHWAVARDRGLQPFAKVQAGTTWELGSVPYLPALYNVAEHAKRRRDEGIDGTMLGWTLGGYPSPNLYAVAEIAAGRSVDEALRATAAKLYGQPATDAVLTAWRQFSDALTEFPFHAGVVYSAPHHVGPANLLWSVPTGFHATMVCFPYDDLPSWCSVYPSGVFTSQFAKVADGFDAGVATLQQATDAAVAPQERHALSREKNVAEAAAIHYRSTANQARFIAARDRLAEAATAADAAAPLAEIEKLLNDELKLAQRLYAIQVADSRIGYEATNHYFYVPLDLAEKALNCRDLLDRWLPAQAARFAAP